MNRIPITILAIGLMNWTLLVAEDPIQDAVKDQNKTALGFNSVFLKPNNTSSDLQNKALNLDKKFETKSFEIEKNAKGFEKKFETSESSFSKTSPVALKAFEVKSSDLAKTASDFNKSTTLSEKNPQEFNKTFETKTYSGPENPQTYKEIQELLQQKGRNSKNGNNNLTIDEVKQIVNRDGHVLPAEETPKVEGQREPVKKPVHSTP